MRWTTEQIDTTKRLKAGGFSTAAIAAALSEDSGREISASDVLGVLRRHDAEANREREADRKAAYFGRRALMIKLAGNGHTVAQIALALGETVASVGWAIATSGGEVGRMVSRWSTYWPDRPPLFAREPDLPEPPVTTGGKEFLDLGERECRWWIGDDPDHHMRFCSAPCVTLKSYCAAHCTASIVPETPDE